MSTNYVQYSFKEGILRLSWYNVAQERKLTPEEARELGDSLVKWSDEQQSPVETGWFCGYTQKPELGDDFEIVAVWRFEGGGKKVDYTSRDRVSCFTWNNTGTRQQPDHADIIRWRYVD